MNASGVVIVAFTSTDLGSGQFLATAGMKYTMKIFGGSPNGYDYGQGSGQISFLE